MGNYATDNSINLDNYKEKEFSKYIFLVGRLSYKNKKIELKTIFRKIIINVSDIISFGLYKSIKDSYIQITLYTNDSKYLIAGYDNVYFAWLICNLLKLNIEQKEI